MLTEPLLYVYSDRVVNNQPRGNTQMTQIKIEVPANDTIALNAFAEALQRIAAERDTTPLTESFTRTVSVGNESITETTVKPVTDCVTSGQMDEGFSVPENYEESIANFHTSPRSADVKFEEAVEEVNAKANVTPPETSDTLDADGIPWDKRIHSKGKSRLADDTWRLRKRPADKDEDEWTTYIDTVKAELKAVQDIPVEPTLDEQAVADVQESETVTPPTLVEQPSTELEGVTPNGDIVTAPDAEAGEPCSPVTPPSAVVPPVAAVTPPTSLIPPVADEPTVKTFPELMKYITTSAAKRGANNDMIKEVLLEVDASLTAIPLIANRVDLIPTFVEKLEVRLA